MSNIADAQKSPINPKLPLLASIASTCYMGLGHVLFLKQYIRGFCLMIFEALMILGCTPVFNFAIPKTLMGLITLGDTVEEKAAKGLIPQKFLENLDKVPARLRDHSIFIMIEGIFMLIIVAIFVFTYYINIKTAKSEAEKIVEKSKYPTWAETHNDLSQNAFPIIGVLPSVLMISIFTVIPLVFSALVAFTNYSSPDHIPPKSMVDWVGFENFKTMFSASYGGDWFRAFWRVAIWTVIWAIFATFSCFFVGFAFAVILQDKRIKLPKIYRTIFILPYAIPQMLSLFVWANLLNGTFGPINRTLQYFGLVTQGIPWLTNPTMARITLILVNIWIGFPYSMILITSSMTAISNSMYEAAEIDGASKWEQFKSITFPLVMYQLKPTLIMQFAGNINNFGAVYFLTAGGPTLSTMAGNNLTISSQAGATDVLISWIYKLTMNTPNQYNLASVLSILVFIVLVPFALYNFTRTKSFKESEI